MSVSTRAGSSDSAGSVGGPGTQGSEVSAISSHTNLVHSEVRDQGGGGRLNSTWLVRGPQEFSGMALQPTH